MQQELLATMMSSPCMTCTVSKNTSKPKQKSHYLAFSVKGHTGDDLEEYDDNKDYKTGSDDANVDKNYDYVADEAEGDYNDEKKTPTTKKPTTTTITTKSTTSVRTTTWSYVGDVEDVDDHVRKRKKQSEEKGYLDICTQRIDTMAVIRSELFVFIGTQMWRFSQRGVLRF